MWVTSILKFFSSIICCLWCSSQILFVLIMVFQSMVWLFLLHYSGQLPWFAFCFLDLLPQFWLLLPQLAYACLLFNFWHHIMLSTLYEIAVMVNYSCFCISYACIYTVTDCENISWYLHFKQHIICTCLPYGHVHTILLYFCVHITTIICKSM